MSHLVPQQPQTFNATRTRFHPSLADVNFNLEAVATVVQTAADALTLKALLRTNRCLVGLYLFRSQDKWAHPLFSYEQKIDWTGCVLSFDITYTGSPVINAPQNGLTMTVLDMSGQAYFMPLQRFVTAGDPSTRTATITIDFDTAAAGFSGETAIPWDFIDCVFISFVDAAYDNKAVLAPLASELAVQADVTNIAVAGANSTVGINTTALTNHELNLADGFSDSYPITPSRIVEQISGLGYHNGVTLYMGFTQFHQLSWDGGVGYLQIDPGKTPVNDPARQWLADFATRLAAAGMTLTVSMSLEALLAFAPAAWLQRDATGAIGRSGWDPPSGFISPCSTAGVAYLTAVCEAMVAVVAAAGCTVRFQAGEFWWWPGGFHNDGPAFYDAATQAAYTAATSNPVPTPFLASIYDDYSAPAQIAFLTWLQTTLGQLTLDLKAAVKAATPGTDCGVLFYTPAISNPLAPMLTLVDFPAAQWASPAWDFVQVEDYEVIEFGNFPQQLKDLDVPLAALGYGLSKVEYFSGFNLLSATPFVWTNIDKALWQAFQRKGYTKCLVWARPQICRDGWVFDHADWTDYAAAIAPTALPSFPAAPLARQGWDVERRSEFSTQISRQVDGSEVRSPNAVYPRRHWTLTFPSLLQIGGQTYQGLKSFFESMAGRDGRFLFADPLFSHCAGQPIGTGDGYQVDFTLTRTIGAYSEPILWLAALTEVKVAGVTVSPLDYTAWYNDLWPQVRFYTPPAAGQAITATYDYAFVCRFKDDAVNFEELVANLHQLQALDFMTVKPR